MPTRRPDSQAERAHAFGARLRALRRERRLTQRQVARAIPMSPGNLSRLENGEHGPPSDEVITALAETLEADVDELLKLAGRDIGGASFERQMLAELARLRSLSLGLRLCFSRRADTDRARSGRIVHRAWRLRPSNP